MRGLRSPSQVRRIRRPRHRVGVLAPHMTQVRVYDIYPAISNSPLPDTTSYGTRASAASLFIVGPRACSSWAWQPESPLRMSSPRAAEARARSFAHQRRAHPRRIPRDPRRRDRRSSKRGTPNALRLGSPTDVQRRMCALGQRIRLRLQRLAGRLHQRRFRSSWPDLPATTDGQIP